MMDYDRAVRSGLLQYSGRPRLTQARGGGKDYSFHFKKPEGLWLVISWVPGFSSALIGSGHGIPTGVRKILGCRLSDDARYDVGRFFPSTCSLAASLPLWGGWAMDRYGPRKVGIFMGVFTGLSLILTSPPRHRGNC